MRLRVQLEWYEQLQAAQVGIQRAAEAIREGKRSRMDPGQDWSVHILGAMGELAFAKATGRYWSGSVNTFKEGGDVGAIQVRTRGDANLPLYIRPTDRDDDVFVLVSALGNGHFEVAGWIYGHEGKRSDFCQEKLRGWKPTYMVPPNRLHPPQALVVDAAEAA